MGTLPARTHTARFRDAMRATRPQRVDLELRCGRVGFDGDARDWLKISGPRTDPEFGQLVGVSLLEAQAQALQAVFEP